ncbi:MAG: hypothetical protein JW712_03060 [Dehalococcoidales bacterium]|nr:hypothetical protein [Dehalococcoidales bacterium]
MVDEGKGYLTVLYNIGLIIVLSVSLGMLIEKILSLVSPVQANTPGNDTKRISKQ